MTQTVEQELDRLDREIERLSAVREYLRESTGRNGNKLTVKRRARTPQSGGRVTAAVAAEKVLAARGEPMRTPDLLVAIRTEGAKMSDSDSLYKTLSRSPKFKKAGRGLWTLA